MVVHSGQVDLGLLGNIAQGGLGEAVLGKQTLGRIENTSAGIVAGHAYLEIKRLFKTSGCQAAVKFVTFLFKFS